LIALVLVCIACWAVALLPLADRLQNPDADEEQDVAHLTLAYSPEKAELVQALIDDFNARDYQTPDGLPMRVELVEMEPEAMLDAAIAGELEAMATVPLAGLTYWRVLRTILISNGVIPPPLRPVVCWPHWPCFTLALGKPGA
jgi:hypothetical protein